jgi:hypothetical protein
VHPEARGAWPGVTPDPPRKLRADAARNADRVIAAAVRPGLGKGRSVPLVQIAAEAGVTLGSWIEGAAAVPDALPATTRRRAAAIAAAVDPGRRIRRSRMLG